MSKRRFKKLGTISEYEYDSDILMRHSRLNSHNFRFERCWQFPFKLEAWIQKRIEGYTLNCPAGKSNTGDVLGDLFPQSKKVQQMDMNKLPFDDNTFDTIISDPPWKLGLYQRPKPFYEAMRVCRGGGLIIYNSTWLPRTKYGKLLELYVRSDARWTQASIISVWRKDKQGSLA